MHCCELVNKVSVSGAFASLHNFIHVHTLKHLSGADTTPADENHTQHHRIITRQDDSSSSFSSDVLSSCKDESCVAYESSVIGSSVISSGFVMFSAAVWLKLKL